MTAEPSTDPRYVDATPSPSPSPSPSPQAMRTMRRWLQTARAWLPQGNMLRAEAFERRHRLISGFAIAQSLALGVFALADGHPLTDAATAVLVPGVPAALAYLPSMSRRMRMLSTVVGLMMASATLVDLTGGLTEAHFHFFVMIGVVALYQDWSAFGMCVLITVLHHAVMGVLAPDSVYANPGERAHPIEWAMVHGGFILAASVTNVIAWKLNEQQELRDPLTQLPNRAAFVTRLHARLRDAGASVSVLFIDIDDFKLINDSRGHHVGDIALAHAAQTMADTMRSGDVVARLGGDEFAVLVAGDAGKAAAAARRLSAALQAPRIVDGHEVFVTASIGVADSALAPSRDANEVLRCADVAMYLAKSSGKNRIVSYTAGLDTAVRERAQLREDLRHALELGELFVHYQPVVRTADRRMCGVEALLRWQHPNRGAVSPVEFIPLAEETGVIKSIGEWVLSTAAEQVAAWRGELPDCAGLELAVNLSPAQLRDPELLPVVAAVLSGTGLPAAALILEVTEGMLLADLEFARDQLDAVRAMGARVAIDDFGTGYSSLSYLVRLPADQLKIDRSFVQALGGGGAPVALVRGIIDMAQALQLDVQAEGVETWQQEQILRELGCPRWQGFRFGRPMTDTQFAEFAAGEAARTSLPALQIVGESVG